MEEPLESQAVSMADLFTGKLQTITQKPTKRKRSSPRAELIEYFFENAKRNWNGKQKLRVSYVGMKLAHLKMNDLYALKSMLEDRCKTLGWIGGDDKWCKFFWGSLITDEQRTAKSTVGRT